MQRHAEQIMGSHSVSGNSQHMNEPMGKSRLTVIAENSPDMTGSRKKTSKYQGMMKSSTGFQDKYRLTKSFDSNGLHSQLDFDYSETVKAEAIQNLSQEDNDPFHKQKSTFLSFKKEAQPKEQVQKKSSSPSRSIAQAQPYMTPSHPPASNKKSINIEMNQQP